MLTDILQQPVVLGSKSPRRRHLIEQLGFSRIRTLVAQNEEIFPEDIKAEQVPEFLARQKAQELNNQVDSGELLITADTIVVLHGKIIGKPENKEDAHRMLRQLSGNTHRVITGVCLLKNNRFITFSETTEVVFAELSNEEISYYINRYLPLDKAGSYGIQEWIGYIGIERINGCYYNVMGLPLHRLFLEIKKAV